MPGAEPDPHLLGAGGYPGGRDHRGGEEVPPIVVAVEVALPKPDGVEPGLIGALDLIEDVGVIP